MKNSLIGLFILLISLDVMANKNVKTALGEFAWNKRQLIVFSPQIDTEQYKKYQEYLIKLSEEFDERNLHTWHIIGNDSVLLNSNIRKDITSQDFREIFSVRSNEFRLLLIGYDQTVKLSQRQLNIESIFNEIDQMPMRIQEIEAK